MRFLFLLLFCLFSLWLRGQSSPPLSAPPTWAAEAVWYQIFPERFRNGDAGNDPVPATSETPPVQAFMPPGWRITPWTHNWYAQEDWAMKSGKPFRETVQMRRFGGDLQGIFDRLDHLQALGINAIYINPVNDASSLHKYDARHYHHIDIHLGPDPQGDLKIMATENPADPATWQWTSADRMFLRLVDSLHQRGIRIIVDYSWNHTGTLFWAWQDILKNQQASPYKDWYAIRRFDDPVTPGNEFQYEGWAGVPSLPELAKVNVVPPRIAGRPYEGNIHPAVKEHIFAVTKRWLAPDGDSTRGIDGFRLDVADQIGLGFWRDYRGYVRSIQPNAYLVGEIWWEKWPDQMMDPVPYTRGDMFDAVMFYQAYRPARAFFADTRFPISAEQLKDSLLFQWNRLKTPNRYAMMNVSSSHDAPRLLTCFANPNQYKNHCTPGDDPGYFTGKPDPDTYQRLRLYLAHLFTTIGAPHIWNGEELGMWGADDPDCRKPLWWKDLTFDREYRHNYNQPGAGLDPVGFDAAHFAWYQKLIRIRRENPVLAVGDLRFLTASGKQLAYLRSDAADQIVVLFNLGAKRARFDLPLEGGTWTDLLTGKTMQAASKGKPTKIYAGPMRSYILKKETNVNKIM
jgi:glycosidase